MSLIFETEKYVHRTIPNNEIIVLNEDIEIYRNGEFRKASLYKNINSANAVWRVVELPVLDAYYKKNKEGK